MSNTLNLARPQAVPRLDQQFRPAVLANHAFVAGVQASGEGVPLVISLERGNGLFSVFETQVYASGSDMAPANLPYVERLVKTLLWQRGDGRSL